jgi:hypothetical protein
MSAESQALQLENYTLTYDLGTFEGFNFRSQSAIERILTAEEVINWDHDGDGEAEFWPSGDHPGVRLVFQSQSAVTYSEICALDRILTELGDDSTESFLKIHYSVSVLGLSLSDLTASEIEDQSLHFFTGSNFTDLRQSAAYELFELYYPEAYAAWEKSLCDGLIFDTDRFLDSPSFSVEELSYGDQKALIISPQ